MEDRKESAKLLFIHWGEKEEESCRSISDQARPSPGHKTMEVQRTYYQNPSRKVIEDTKNNIIVDDKEGRKYKFNPT